MNEQTATLNPQAPASVEAIDTAGLPAARNSRGQSASLRKRESESCGCGSAPDSDPKALRPSYVYAIGRVEARFPNLAAEKEFAQAGGRTDTAGKDRPTDLSCGSVQAARTVT